MRRSNRLRSQIEGGQAQYAALEAECAGWNAAHDVGTIVEYHPVIGRPEHRLRQTKTRAQILSGHTAVVWLEGESGCVALDACTVPTVKFEVCPKDGCMYDSGQLVCITCGSPLRSATAREVEDFEAQA